MPGVGRGVQRGISCLNVPGTRHLELPLGSCSSMGDTGKPEPSLRRTKGGGSEEMMTGHFIYSLAQAVRSSWLVCGRGVKSHSPSSAPSRSAAAAGVGSAELTCPLDRSPPPGRQFPQLCQGKTHSQAPCLASKAQFAPSACYLYRFGFFFIIIIIILTLPANRVLLQ